MGIPDVTVNTQVLLSALDERANQEKAAIRADAENAIRLIHEQTEQAIESLRGETERQAAQSLRRAQDQRLGQAKTKARLAFLKAKRQYLDQAFERAGERILALQVSPEYRAVLTSLIRGALVQIGPDATLTASPADVTLCQAVVEKEGLACSVGPVQKDYGADKRIDRVTDQGILRFTSADGQRSVDNGLLTRLTRARSRCQAEAAEVLFGSDTEEVQGRS